MNKIRRFLTITLILIIALGFYNKSVAQDSTDCKVLFIDKQPVFDGDLNTFIQNKIQYPDSAMNHNIEGKVYVSLWIETTGKTSYHKILKGVNKELDKEALRVAKLIKFKEAAIKNGKPKRIRYIVSVNFKLDKKP